MIDILGDPYHIEVPGVILTSKAVFPSAKVVWMTLLLDSKLDPQIRHSPTRLAKRIGLSRPTIRHSLTVFRAIGWYHESEPYRIPYSKGRTITMQTDLLLDKSMSITAKLCYGLLQLLSTAHKSSYATMAESMGIGVKAVRDAISELVGKGWLAKEQANQLSPMVLSLRHPLREFYQGMRIRAERNLKAARFKGESLMHEFLSLIVDSDDYMDNVRPGFLRNTTDYLMEFDRFYLGWVAIEFNGPQHYEANGFIDGAMVEPQLERDALKKRICGEKGIRLIIIHPEDLTLSGMLMKIGDCLPLRNLRGAEPLITFLEMMGAAYRKSMTCSGNQP